jgi:uncharacterized membrane protein YdfJ with MMPL/SSD domain
MGLPILTAISGLAVGMGIITLLSHTLEVPTSAPALATMIGLGVGIDYALFIVTRHRDQLAGGVEAHESVARATATSGGAVFFAGGTVIIALLSLKAAGIPIITALGFTATIVVLAAVLAAITLLPAVLGLIGLRINSLRLPGMRTHHDERPHGWARWATFVGSHPWAAMVVGFIILLVLAIPIRLLHLGQYDNGAMPKSTQLRQSYDMMSKGFGVGSNGPILIAVNLSKPAHNDQADLNKLHKQQKQQQAKQQKELQQKIAHQQAKADKKIQQQAQQQQKKADKQIQQQAQQQQAQADKEIQQQADAAIQQQPQEQAAIQQQANQQIAQQNKAIQQQAQQEIAKQNKKIQQEAQQKQAQENKSIEKQAKQQAAKQQNSESAQQQEAKAKQQEEFLKSKSSDPRLVNLRKKMQKTKNVDSVTLPLVNKKGNAAVYTVTAKTAPSSRATEDLVRTLRDDVIPDATKGKHMEADVGGTTASYIDLAREISAKLPLVIGIVLALSFLVLLMAFRSLLVPLKAVIMNTFSILAAFGVVTYAFDHDWSARLIGLDGTVPIVSFVPLMMFAVLFGLSMDYEVFLMTHIRERWKETGEPHEAVVHGLAATARVITSAALVMVSVFLAFVVNGDPTIKQFGLGMAAAVGVDATVVRCVLVPAIMSLLGYSGWWMPAWLERVTPALSIEGKEYFEELEAAEAARATEEPAPEEPAPEPEESEEPVPEQPSPDGSQEPAPKEPDERLRTSRPGDNEEVN